MTIDTAIGRDSPSTCPACAGAGNHGEGTLCAICLGSGGVVRAPRYIAALDVIDAQAAEIERLRAALLSICDSADAVMGCLDDWGEGAAAYLIDTDDNPGQWLRDDIARNRAALSEREP